MRFSILYLVINWRSLKSYFLKKLFLISAAVDLLLSVTLVVFDYNHKDHNEKLIEQIVTAPIAETCVVLGIDISQLGCLVGSDDVVVGEQETIESLAKRNDISPGKLLALTVENPH